MRVCIRESGGSVCTLLFIDTPTHWRNSIPFSFAVRMGAKRIFNVCVGLLIVDYLVGVAVGFMSTTPWSSVRCWLTMTQ